LKPHLVQQRRGVQGPPSGISASFTTSRCHAAPPPDRPRPRRNPRRGDPCAVAHRRPTL